MAIRKHARIFKDSIFELMALINENAMFECWIFWPMNGIFLKCAAISQLSQQQVVCVGDEHFCLMCS